MIIDDVETRRFPMSLRSVEMQIALPRTQEIGNMHSQAQQRPTLEQAALAGESAKTTEQLRQKNTEIDETVHVPIRDQQPRQQSSSHRDNKKKNEKLEASETCEHPYKGHHIDFSL